MDGRIDGVHIGEVKVAIMGRWTRIKSKLRISISFPRSLIFKAMNDGP
jgi:hypothetical protein